MARREFKWTNLQQDKLNKVIEVLNELKEYRPLTLRQIYYQLVGKGFIENNVSQYGMLSQLLKWARIDGFIPWEYVEDRVRAFHDLTGWRESEEFIKYSLKYFMNDYRRDLMKSQDKYLEIWIEKDALSSIFTRVAVNYTIPVVVCRGFSSVSFLHEFKERLKNYKNKQVKMLYFGDFDPSGVEMLESMKITLKKEMRVSGIDFKRVALLKDDIYTYNLPHNPDALKKSDTRAKKHLANYGELAVELDALRPDVLIQKIENAVQSEIDMEALNLERRREKVDFDKLNEFRGKVLSLYSRWLNGR